MRHNKGMKIITIRISESLYSRIKAKTNMSLDIPFEDRVSFNQVVIESIEKGLDK
jgi:predicted DNA binding CopG/RHH family protein